MSVAAAESRFRRNIMRIASGTVFSQAIIIAAVPVLSRFYRPEDFGALAVFTSLHVLIAALFTLKYELAIILPGEPAGAQSLTLLTLVNATAFSTALLLGLYIGEGLELFTDWFYFLLPLGAVLAAATACGQQWSARTSDYRRYAHSQVLNSTTNVVTAFALIGLATLVTGELIIAYMVGLAVSTAYLAVGFAHEVKAGWSGGSASPRALVATANEYRRFPLLVLPTSLLSMVGTTALPFILQSMFSLREVGLYAIASRLLLAPGILVGNAVSEAFRSEFVGRMRGGPITPFFRVTLLRILAFGVPAFALAFALAPMLFAIVFGADYRESGILARYLCLGVLGQFLAQPFGYVFVATGNASRWLFAQAAGTILPIGGIVVGGLRADLHLALLLYSLSTLACSTMLVGMAYRCCKRYDRRAHQKEAV